MLRTLYMHSSNPGEITMRLLIALLVGACVGGGEAQTASCTLPADFSTYVGFTPGIEMADPAACPEGGNVAAGSACNIKCGTGYTSTSAATLAAWTCDAGSPPAMATITFACVQSCTLSSSFDSTMNVGTGAELADGSGCAAGQTLTHGSLCALQCATGYTLTTGTETYVCTDGAMVTDMVCGANACNADVLQLNAVDTGDCSGGSLNSGSGCTQTPDTGYVCEQTVCSLGTVAFGDCLQTCTFQSQVTFDANYPTSSGIELDSCGTDTVMNSGTACTLKCKTGSTIDGSTNPNIICTDGTMAWVGNAIACDQDPCDSSDISTSNADSAGSCGAVQNAGVDCTQTTSSGDTECAVTTCAFGTPTYGMCHPTEASCTGSTPNLCPPESSDSTLKGTCVASCTACTDFTIEGDTCVAPSETTCTVAFCPAAASAQASTCVSSCTGCGDYTSEGDTCTKTMTGMCKGNTDSSGDFGCSPNTYNVGPGVHGNTQSVCCEPPSERTCQADTGKKFCSVTSTCVSSCSGCTGNTAEAATCAAPAADTCAADNNQVFCLEGSGADDTCETDCSSCTGLTGLTADGRTCTAADATTCAATPHPHKVFCPAGSNAGAGISDTCQPACTGCTDYTAEAATCKAPAGDSCKADGNQVYCPSDQLCHGADDDVAAINAITAATIGVITTAAPHTLKSADFVRISGVVGMTEINDLVFGVTKLSDTTFTVNLIGSGDLDTSTYTTYTSGGTISKMACSTCGSPDEYSVTGENNECETPSAANCAITGEAWCEGDKRCVPNDCSQCGENRVEVNDECVIANADTCYANGMVYCSTPPASCVGSTACDTACTAFPILDTTARTCVAPTAASCKQAGKVFCGASTACESDCSACTGFLAADTSGACVAADATTCAADSGKVFCPDATPSCKAACTDCTTANLVDVADTCSAPTSGNCKKDGGKYYCPDVTCVDTCATCAENEMPVPTATDHTCTAPTQADCVTKGEKLCPGTATAAKSSCVAACDGTCTGFEEEGSTCEADITGQCISNTNNVGDVPCADKTLNKGPGVDGTTAAECCVAMSEVSCGAKVDAAGTATPSSFCPEASTDAGRRGRCISDCHDCTGVTGQSAGYLCVPATPATCKKHNHVFCPMAGGSCAATDCVTDCADFKTAPATGLDTCRAAQKCGEATCPAGTVPDAGAANTDCKGVKCDMTPNVDGNTCCADTQPCAGNFAASCPSNSHTFAANGAHCVGSTCKTTGGATTAEAAAYAADVDQCCTKREQCKDRLCAATSTLTEATLNTYATGGDGTFDTNFQTSCCTDFPMCAVGFVCGNHATLKPATVLCLDNTCTPGKNTDNCCDTHASCDRSDVRSTASGGQVVFPLSITSNDCNAGRTDGVVYVRKQDNNYCSSQLCAIANNGVDFDQCCKPQAPGEPSAVTRGVEDDSVADSVKFSYAYAGAASLTGSLVALGA
jgi:hypothetical protein